LEETGLVGEPNKGIGGVIPGEQERKKRFLLTDSNLIELDLIERLHENIYTPCGRHKRHKPKEDIDSQLNVSGP
jgi:hypothetical protein